MLCRMYCTKGASSTYPATYTNVPRYGSTRSSFTRCRHDLKSRSGTSAPRARSGYPKEARTLMISVPGGLTPVPAQTTSKGYRRIKHDIPFFPVDVVKVEDPHTVEQCIRSPDLGRCFELGKDLTPLWMRIFWGNTRFFCHIDKSSAVALLGTSGTSGNYKERVDTVKSALAAQPHTEDDVRQVLHLALEASETAKRQLDGSGEQHAERNDAMKKLNFFLANLVCSRFFDGKQIPVEVIEATQVEMLNLTEYITNPLKPLQVARAHEVAARWIEANKGNDKMQLVDYIHNINTAANEVRMTVMTLVQNPDVPLEKLFTRAENCPVKQAPRVAVRETTLGGLLPENDPAIPGKTVFMFSADAAAEKTGCIFYTFGAGVPERSCAFLPYWKEFMKDLQAALQETTTLHLETLTRSPKLKNLPVPCKFRGRQKRLAESQDIYRFAHVGKGDWRGGAEGRHVRGAWLIDVPSTTTRTNEGATTDRP